MGNAFRFLLAAALCVPTMACQDEVQYRTSNVCFEGNILPLVKRDCSACHENGEWGVRLSGAPADYSALLLYTAPDQPDYSLSLWYAAGFDGHPVIWPPDSKAYAMFAAWVSEGAGQGCGAPAADIADVTVDDIDAPDDMATSDMHFGDLLDSAGGELGNDLAMSDSLAEIGPQDLLGDLIEDLGVQDIVDTTEPKLLSFANDISPIHKSGCASCHKSPFTKPKILGDPSDYGTVMAYIDPANADATAWNWASGNGVHKNLYKWGKTGEHYLLFLQWVKEGANNN